MLAFSSVSHVGLVVLGIASLNLQGIQGAVLQLLNFTVVSGGLFLITGFLHHRTGTTESVSLGGAARSMPMLATFFLLLGLAAIGVPGTNGFPAELLLILSALGTHTGAGLAAIVGLVLGSAYFLGIYRRTFLGPVTSPVVADAQDLRRRELTIAAVLMLVVLAIGLYPQFVLDLIRTASEGWVARIPAP
jgi:NADH-quinone oxidoreductase subunit M